VKEHVAEFSYRPGLCEKNYRVGVVWKHLQLTQGQQKLFDKERCFFSITNDWKSSAAEIVSRANDRCNQEHLIQQPKSGLPALTAPRDNLLSKGASRVIASRPGASRPGRRCCCPCMAAGASSSKHSGFY
jgi:hypothetical protein